jgi:hypothetical protein
MFVREEEKERKEEGWKIRNKRTSVRVGIRTNILN